MYKINDGNSFTHLKTCLDMIRQYSVGNPIIYIVGNFSDLKESREVSQEDLQKLTGEEGIEYFEVSCKNGNGINEVLIELTKEIIVIGKWYISKISKDLGDFNALEKAENGKLEKHLKNFSKDKKPKFLRCQAFDRLFIARFKTMFNEVSFICNNCKFETNVPFSRLDS